MGMKPINQYYSLEQALNSVGRGWHDLILRVYNAREAMGLPVGIILVKEKMGILRIYAEYLVNELEDIIIQVGKESETICEMCGNSGRMRKTYSRYKTLCDECGKNWTIVD